MLAAAWLTDSASGLLALFAVVTAWYARKAFREQSREVGLLQEQALHEQQDFRRESEERHRQRAALVYVTTDFDQGLRLDRSDAMLIAVPRDPSITMHVHNTGRQPVYDVRIHWLADSGAQGGAEDSLGTLGPDSEKAVTREMAEGAYADQFVPVTYFRDAAGLRWTLMADGGLDEVAPGYPAGAPAIATEAFRRSRDRPAAPQPADGRVTRSGA